MLRKTSYCHRLGRIPTPSCRYLGKAKGSQKKKKKKPRGTNGRRSTEHHCVSSLTLLHLVTSWLLSSNSSASPFSSFIVTRLCFYKSDFPSRYPSFLIQTQFLLTHTQTVNPVHLCIVPDPSVPSHLLELSALTNPFTSIQSLLNTFQILMLFIL